MFYFQSYEPGEYIKKVKKALAKKMDAFYPPVWFITKIKEVCPVETKHNVTFVSNNDLITKIKDRYLFKSEVEVVNTALELFEQLIATQENGQIVNICPANKPQEIDRQYLFSSNRVFLIIDPKEE